MSTLFDFMGKFQPILSEYLIERESKAIRWLLRQFFSDKIADEIEIDPVKWLPMLQWADVKVRLFPEDQKGEISVGVYKVAEIKYDDVP